MSFERAAVRGSATPRPRIRPAPRGGPPLALALLPLGALILAALPVSIVVAAVSSSPGGQQQPGAGSLLAITVAIAAITYGIVIAGANAAGWPLDRRAIGLVRARAVAVPALIATAALIALAALSGVLIHPSAHLQVPPELSHQSSAARAYGLPDVTQVTVSGPFLAFALAQAIIGPLAVIPLLLGLVLPALAARLPPWAAIGAIALVAGATISSQAGGARMLIPGILLAGLMVWLYQRTASVIGPIALAAAAYGALLGAACHFDAASCAGVAGACGALALGAAHAASATPAAEGQGRTRLP